ncbi:hypothetical protein R3I94_009194 [Phoxinus phoxinus]
MAITWTIIVLGALLHDKQCTSTNSTLAPLQTTINPILSTASNPSSNSSHPPSSTSSNPTTLSLPTTALLDLTTSATLTPTISAALTPTISATLIPTTPTSSNPTTITLSSPSTAPTLNPSATISLGSTPPITIFHTDASSTSLTTEEPAQQPRTSDSPQQVTTQIITSQPAATIIKATSTESNLSSQNTPSDSQDTTSSNQPATTTHKESETTPVNKADPSAVTTNPAPDSTSAVSQSIQTTEAQASSTTIESVDPATSTSSPGNMTYSYDLSRSSSEGDIILETCKKLGQKIRGNCSVTLEIHGKQLFATIKINADQNIPPENYKPLEQKEPVSEETIPDTLIAILASSGALVLILCCFAAYCTYHRRSYRKNQQHLTEEMQTVENGYHDNPTLEVMEIQPEMQEKKLTLNGEFNDSWIVPIDNLLKEDIPDEEDTHL